MAATITSLGSNITRHTLQWDASKSQAGLATGQSNSGTRTLESSYTFGTAAGLSINQVVVGTVSLAGGATTDYNISTGMTLSNVVGTSAPTLTAVKEFWIELLATAQTDDSGTAGSAATSVTLGADSGTPWDSGPLGATSTYTLANGDKWCAISNTGAGYLISSGDILQILNNDGAVAAKIRITLLGVA